MDTPETNVLDYKLHSEVPLPLHLPGGACVKLPRRAQNSVAELSTWYSTQNSALARSAPPPCSQYGGP